MWKRAELKRRGRENFRKNYWPAAAVSLVLAVMMTNIGGPYLIRGEKYNLVSILWTDLLIPWKFQTGIGIVLIRDILYIFIFAVIEVGGAAFYIRNREEPVSYTHLGGICAGHGIHAGTGAGFLSHTLHHVHLYVLYRSGPKDHGAGIHTEKSS